MVVGYYIHFRMFDGYEAAEEPETKEKTSLKDFGTSLIQNPPLIALLIACISPYVYVFVTSGIAIYYFQPVGNRKNAAGWITGLQMVPFLAYSKRMREGGKNSRSGYVCSNRSVSGGKFQRGDAGAYNREIHTAGMVEVRRMEKQKLIQEAYKAPKNAYAPYSRFRVGAALLGKSGKVYQGCNIENASFSAGICAERTAFAKALSEGETEFTAIAITGGKEGENVYHYCPPCGVCRQFMREFCSLDTFQIYLHDTEKGSRSFLLGELFPESFGPEFIGKEA